MSVPQQRRPGRPATYVFDKPESELTEEDRKLRNAVLKRRSRQNRSYYRRKEQKKDGQSNIRTRDWGRDRDEELGGHTYDKNSEGADLSVSEFGNGGSSFNPANCSIVDEDLIESAEPLRDDYADVPKDIDEDIEECLMLAMKGTMDRSVRLSRSAGVKDVLFGNLRDRFGQLSADGQEAMRALSVFPRDFDMVSAATVMGKNPSNGLNGAIDLLQPLFVSGFLMTKNGRFQLNDVTKMFLEEECSLRDGVCNSMTSKAASRRYTQHFQKLLVELTDPSIHKLGFAREHAMQVFDVERENMNYSIELCRTHGAERLREFLAAGAVVMRYCVDAPTRMHYLEEALATEKTGSASSSSTSSTGKSGINDLDRRHIIRLEVARAEALCDTQSLEEAEEPLKKAMNLMDFDYTKSPSGIMDTVLVFLLLAGVKINLNKIEDGHKLLVEALKILNKVGLGKTTLAVNALTNLVTIYVERGQHDMANYVATQLLSTLHAMRYENMPIYADALGVLAMVRMALGDYADAARQFGAALEIVAGWGSKKWTSVPVQHCLDLDIWLMEGLAVCLNLQQCEKDAVYMAELAGDARSSRGLRPISCDILGGESIVREWIHTSRHLY